MKTIKVTSIVLLALLFTACNTEKKMADFVKPANIFSDNMVLQREKPINVWGVASPNSILKIQFNKQEKITSSNADSIWQISLDDEQAGGPFKLYIIGKDTVVYSNVLVGEVWICSGQSNMEMPLAGWGQINNFEQEIAEANYPNIRLRTIERLTSLTPQTSTAFKSWEECSSSTIADFSATAYFFGRKLYKELNVPIGLIHTSWGGTPVEAWTPTEFISRIDDIKPIISYDERTIDTTEKVKDDFKLKTEKWYKNQQSKLVEIENELPDMTAINIDDSDWDIISLPQPWEDVEGGLGYVDGVVWFRKTFKVNSHDLQNDEFEISLGYIHDKNKTYINGTFIGENITRWGSDITKYTIPKKVIKKGINTIAIKITNYGWIGGICRDKESLWVKNSKEFNIDLTGNWKYKMIFNFDELSEMPVSPLNSNEPAVLYNGMINPIISYTIGGCIWYQGEANADRPIQYRKLFPLMIESWRTKWNQGDFPFYFVQLANFMEQKAESQNSNWAALREAQSMTLSVSNTGQAVAIDIGDAGDIHPKNKQEVGRRLALNALNLSYGKDIVYSGPMYESMEIIGDTVKLKFTHIGGGLVVKDSEKLQSFSIAGEDKNFVWANTKIVGESVYVWSSKVKKPLSVRYGWADNPNCNLYNKYGLPASPFRTDSWKIKVE